MERLFLLGLNHTTAPLAVRERLAFSAESQRAAIVALREQFPDTEAVLLSTCNRVELYFARQTTGDETGATPQAIAQFLAQFHSVPVDSFSGHLYSKRGRAVVEHAFSVATSLDSMVLGETQIVGQVRRSYDLAKALGATGSMLNPLFQRALAVGKEVLSTTTLGDGRLSVASVAVDYAKRIFETFGDKTILSIGAGKMACLVLEQFSALGPGRLLVCNRDPRKAEALAAECSGQVVPFDQLDQELMAADIVCSSTGATHPIITRRQVQAALKARRYRPIVLLDIAVPRDVEQSVGELDRVYLYNIDDLQQVVSATQAQRGGALDAARAIATKHVDDFVAWQARRAMGPAIDSLYKRYHELAKAEVERAASRMPNMTEEQRAQLDDMARRIVNKLLHDPVKAMHIADAQHALSGQYIHALQKLFQLDQPSGAGGGEPTLWTGGADQLATDDDGSHDD